MIQTKYLVIIGIIICLMVLYYFYDEIKKMKKSFVPTYQKTMALESKITNIEKQIATFAPKRKMITKQIDSPAYSISYQSDMIKNGNLSVRYADITETEACELLRNMEKNKNNSYKKNKLEDGSFSSPNRNAVNNSNSKPKSTRISEGDFGSNSGNKMSGNCNDLSEFDSVFNNGSQIASDIQKMGDLYTDKSDTINVDLSYIINKNQPNALSLFNNENNNEYQAILDNLTKDVSNLCSGPNNEFFSSDCIDQDIVKNISESIHYADMSDTILSDIPDDFNKKPKKKSDDNNISKPKNNKKKVSNR